MNKKKEITNFDVLHNQIKFGEKNIPQCFIELGIALKEVRNTDAYEEAGKYYGSFPDYRDNETNISRTTANALIHVAELAKKLLSTPDGFILLKQTKWSKARKLCQNTNQKKYNGAIKKGLLSFQEVAFFGLTETKSGIDEIFKRYAGHDLWSRILATVYCPDRYERKKDRTTPATELYERLAQKLYEQFSIIFDNYKPPPSIYRNHQENFQLPYFSENDKITPKRAAAVCYELLKIKRGFDTLCHWWYVTDQRMGFNVFVGREFHDFFDFLCEESDVLEEDGEFLWREARLKPFSYLHYILPRDFALHDLSNPFYSLPPPREIPEFLLSEYFKIMEKGEINKLVNDGYVNPTVVGTDSGEENRTFSLKEARKIIIIADLKLRGKDWREAAEIAEDWVNVEDKVYSYGPYLNYFLTTVIIEEELQREN